MYSIFRFALPARLTLITLLAACDSDLHCDGHVRQRPSPHFNSESGSCGRTRA
jgi:hypothetical protein